MAHLADTIVFGDLTVTRDHLVKGTLTIEGLLNFTGNLSVGGVVSGNGSGLTNLNASALSTGTVPTARLPASALIGDTTYSAGTGLSLSGTTFNVANPFNPSGSYSGLRAQATTKGDVGLGSVRNVASYSQAESDARYLGISAKAADSTLLNGLGSGSFIRSNATDVASGRITFSNAAGLEVPRGITGGYGDSAGTGSNWGASIWGMGDAYNGSGNGVSHAPGSYEIAWLRASHTNANSNVGEGLYVFSQGSYRGGLGTAGGHTTGDFKVNGELTATDVIITSDRRVKSELEELDSALEKVLSLTGYTYAMKGLPKGARRMGLIAQDVLEVFPEAVHGSEETSYSLSYGSIIAALVEAIKSQQTQIEEIRDRLTPSHFSR